MKKILFSIFALLLGVVASAQDGFSVLGGITSSSTRIEELNLENAARCHFGVAYKRSILYGFAVQPELWYDMKGANVPALIEGHGAGMLDLKMGYAELGTQLQWGPDLVLFRPFVFFEPFIGYAINNNITRSCSDNTFRTALNNSWECLKRLEYGYGMGGGLELFGMFQLTAKHFRNLGPLLKDGPCTTAEARCLTSSLDDNSNFGGWVFSLGFFF